MGGSVLEQSHLVGAGAWSHPTDLLPALQLSEQYEPSWFVPSAKSLPIKLLLPVFFPPLSKLDRRIQPRVGVVCQIQKLRLEQLLAPEVKALLLK